MCPRCISVSCCSVNDPTRCIPTGCYITLIGSRWGKAVNAVTGAIPTSRIEGSWLIVDWQSDYKLGQIPIRCFFSLSNDRIAFDSCLGMTSTVPFAHGQYAVTKWCWEPKILRRLSITVFLKCEPWSDTQSKTTPYRLNQSYNAWAVTAVFAIVAGINSQKRSYHLPKRVRSKNHAILSAWIRNRNEVFHLVSLPVMTLHMFVGIFPR